MLKTYSLSPSREKPFRADESVCDQYSIHNSSFDNIYPNDSWVHRVGIFSPCRLSDSFPWMAKIEETIKIQKNMNKL